MKKIFKALFFLLSFLWQLPQAIVGLVMLIYFKLYGGAELLSYRKMCFAYSAKRMRGGISLGCFAFVSPRLAKDEATVAHEQLGHTHDSKLMGPLYLFIIGLPSLIHAARRKYSCYYDFYTEERANRFAGVDVVRPEFGRCYLVMKEK